MTKEEVKELTAAQEKADQLCCLLKVSMLQAEELEPCEAKALLSMAFGLSVDIGFYLANK